MDLIHNKTTSLEILREIFEDADIFVFIKAGAYIDAYDRVADLILPKLSKDLSISQIQDIIWEAFYQDCCRGNIGGTKEPFDLDKEQARAILGHSDRFKGIAINIRHMVIGI